MPGTKLRRSVADKSSFHHHASPYGPDDKIKIQYDIYINKTDKHIMVLQFPNRDRKQPYNSQNGQKPLELRIKPISGLVEVDVPLVVERCYDQAKGLEYGKAISKSRVLRQGGSYGLAGGLGVNAPAKLSRDEMNSSVEDVPDEALLESFEDSVSKGLVMNKLTLGGRIIKHENGKPNYYIGVFKGMALHLTRVSAFCSLSPQFHHLDALNEIERASNRAQREAENPTPESEARAVNMAVKSTDNEELDMGQVAKQLRDIEEEPWQHLEWVDEEDPCAYITYEKQLVLDTEFQGSKLVSAMTKQQYLDALSAPRVDPTKQGKKIMMSRPHSDNDSSDEAPGGEADIVNDDARSK